MKTESSQTCIGESGMWSGYLVGLVVRLEALFYLKIEIRLS